MNCLTPHDAVCNLLDLVQRELTAQIDEVIRFYGRDAEDALLTPLNSGDFYQQEPYRGMVIELHNVETTFAAQVDTMTANLGPSFGGEYAEHLSAQVRDHVESRIQFHRIKESGDAA